MSQAKFRWRGTVAAQATTLLLLVGVSSFADAATPINDLGSGLYLGQFQGGLYPGGSNTMPAAHAAEGLSRIPNVRPLDAAGNPSPTGKYVLLSVGMSNTALEFFGATGGGGGSGSPSPLSFMGQAAADPQVNHSQLVIANGAAGNQGAQNWDAPTKANYDRVRDVVLAPRGLTEQQVQVVWLKQANEGSPTRPALPAANADAYELLSNLGEITRALHVRYPNLQQVFVSSRSYGGYAPPNSNSPEPYAYETGFSVKWLIESQIEQMSGLGIDPVAGDLNYDTSAPWVSWAPYLWADGVNPRSDGLTWPRADYSADGVHPSPQGVEKVGGMLLDFFKTSEFTQSWFTTPVPEPSGLLLLSGFLSLSLRRTARRTDKGAGKVSRT